MNFKYLKDNLSPEYYNFRSQYLLVIKIITESNIEDIEKKMKILFKTGRLEEGKVILIHFFHPAVVSNLKSILRTT